MEFAAGLVVGVALGLIVIGFLAIGAYDRGYDAAVQLRASWSLRAKAGAMTHSGHVQLRVA